MKTKETAEAVRIAQISDTARMARINKSLRNEKSIISFWDGNFLVRRIWDLEAELAKLKLEVK